MLSRMDDPAKIRKRLAEIALAREEEPAVIADAWRAGIPPGEIAEAAGRSGAHIRRFRPDDVPPAKLGGNAARPPAE